MITEPNLNCEHCFKLFKDAKIKPLCKQERGCPIEDLATDIEVNEFCHRFTFAKNLFLGTQQLESQNRIFRKLDLFENESLWLEMELIYAQWLAEYRRKNTKR